MRLISKKGIFKTIESVMASLIIVLFIVYLSPSNQNIGLKNELTVIEVLKTNSTFRECVTEYNNTCIDSILSSKISDQYEYAFLVTDNHEAIYKSLPDKKIMTQEIFFSKNDEFGYRGTIFRLYYWLEDSN